MMAKKLQAIFDEKIATLAPPEIEVESRATPSVKRAPASLAPPSPVDALQRRSSAARPVSYSPFWSFSWSD